MASKYPQLDDSAWLIEQYVNRGRSSTDIAAEVGCTSGNVHYRLRRLKVKMRGRWSDRWNPKTCERCGAEYLPSGPAQQFCSGECRAGTTLCEECGIEFALSKPKRKKLGVYPRRFCSMACRRVWVSRNASHRYVNAQGYVTIKVPPTMSRNKNSHGYVRVNLGATTGRKDGRMLEHRFVMEQALGRQLEPHETVHHINGDKTDNRLENLQLRSGRHGKGAHFVCGDCGSHNLVAKPL